MCHPGLFLRWWPEFMLRPLWNLAHCRRSSKRDIARWLRSSCHWWHSSHCRFHETQPQTHGNFWRSWKQTRSIQLIIRLQDNKKLSHYFWADWNWKIMAWSGSHDSFQNWYIISLWSGWSENYRFPPSKSTNFCKLWPSPKTTHPKEARNLEKKHLCKTLCELRNCAVLGLRLLYHFLFLHPIL